MRGFAHLQAGCIICILLINGLKLAWRLRRPLLERHWLILHLLLNHKYIIMKKLTKEEREKRIIARGEFSGHSHIITGEAEVRNERGNILIDIKGTASIEHLLEDIWLKEGKKVHTKEHAARDLTEMPAQIRQGDIFLEKVGDKTYKYVQQQTFDPLTKRIENARD